ncbi:MAG: FeoB-associated Cys-rich membrane protein [Acutalibacteraceae bacterium]
MLDWISSNLGTIIVSLILLLIIFLIVMYMRKSKKQGKTSCGCNCSSCPMSGECHSSNQNNK